MLGNHQGDILITIIAMFFVFLVQTVLFPKAISQQEEQCRSRMNRIWREGKFLPASAQVCGVVGIHWQHLETGRIGGMGDSSSSLLFFGGGGNCCSLEIYVLSHQIQGMFGISLFQAMVVP